MQTQFGGHLPQAQPVLSEAVPRRSRYSGESRYSTDIAPLSTDVLSTVHWRIFEGGVHLLRLSIASQCQGCEIAQCSFALLNLLAPFLLLP